MEAALERLELGDDQEVLVIVGPRPSPERTEVPGRFFPGRVRILSARSWLPLDGYDVARRALEARSNIGAIVRSNIARCSSIVRAEVTARTFTPSVRPIR